MGCSIRNLCPTKECGIARITNGASFEARAKKEAPGSVGEDNLTANSLQAGDNRKVRRL